MHSRRSRTGVVEWVTQRTTKQRNGPFSIHWERSEDKMLSAYLEKLALDQDMSAIEVKAVIGNAGDQRALDDVGDYLDRQRRAKGRNLFTAGEIEAVIRQPAPVWFRQCPRLSSDDRPRRQEQGV
jgi:hypothetical protein